MNIRGKSFGLFVIDVDFIFVSSVRGKITKHVIFVRMGIWKESFKFKYFFRYEGIMKMLSNNYACEMKLILNSRIIIQRSGGKRWLQFLRILF